MQKQTGSLGYYSHSLQISITCICAHAHMYSQVVDDPSGNSFVENRVAPSPNPHLSVEFYHRTQEQNKALNISPASIEVSCFP